MESGWFDNLLLDIDKADAIVKMLDAGMWIWEGKRVSGDPRSWFGNRSQLISKRLKARTLGL